MDGHRAVAGGTCGRGRVRQPYPGISDRIRIVGADRDHGAEGRTEASSRSRRNSESPRSACDDFKDDCPVGRYADATDAFRYVGERDTRRGERDGLSWQKRL